jgi:uncharacterized protein GlcG (DUF336 family)
MIQAGHAQAKELDIAVSVAVVDEGGRLSAFGRMDRARSTQGKIMAVAGGLPVLDSPHVVGAVGVSGGTEEQDQECCRAAVAAY